MKDRLTPADIIDNANDIARSYQRKGLKLTLRQLYYQFVTQALFGNDQKNYARLAAVLAKARYAGTFPVDGLEDRGRDVGLTRAAYYLTDIDRALELTANDLRTGPNYLQHDRWFGQPNVVSVWVEKEALAGVFDAPCRREQVGLFPCKGYPSISALQTWIDWANSVAEVWEEHGFETPVFNVLYFGDHDPSGFNIPVAAEEAVEKLRTLAFCKESEIPVAEADDDWMVRRWKESRYQVRFARCALSMEQVRQYDPPPFAAKAADSRFREYCQQQNTRDAWELDALEPQVLQDLITARVRDHFDEQVARRNDRDIQALRSVMRRQMQNPEWIAGALQG